MIRQRVRPHLRPGPPWRQGRGVSNGFSLIELMIVVSIAVMVATIAIPGFTAAVDDYRTLGAARYLSSQLHLTRAEAVARAANTALRFEPTHGSYTFSIYVDGNRNGISLVDIDDGIDRRLAAATSLKAQFRGVDFGMAADLPSPDDALIEGADPIRFGVTSMAVFTARGTATPGSVYIKGGRGTQYVVRVFGDTGKSRLLKFNRARRQWDPA
jgi:prepilin-type N-terminal cleavage/methylation domain-containing protein